MKMPFLQNTIVYDCIYDSKSVLSHIKPDELIKISIVIDGNGMFCFLNETIECRTGDIYIINSGTPHGFFAKSDNEKPTVATIWFNVKDWLSDEWADINSPHFCYGVFRDNLPISYAMLNSRSLKEVVNIYNLISKEFTREDIEWQSAIRSHLTMLLITISRYINMADTIKSAHSKDWVVVSSAIREVLDRYSDSEMTLESIASSLFISASHLSRLFQKVIGESFLDYVRSVRINKACALLKNTNLTNEEIMQKCGLKDIPTFYKIFKTNMGVTPFQYRMSQNYNKGEKTMSIINEISENLQRGKAKIVKELVENAISEGVPAAQILNEGLLGGMNIIGEKFKNNEVYVPEVLVAARAMNTGMTVLKPLLIEDGVQATGKVCIGTVQGDLHDIGKNLVKMMMEGKGLEVVDLGTDVTPEAFVQAAIDENCAVVCCSALLTTTMDVMADVVKAFENSGNRDKVKIMIGGAPITEEYCAKIGADCYTSDAASAADAAVELCK